MIKLALFDLDNTLYPTHEQVIACRKAAIKAMIKRGLPGTIEEQLKKLNAIVKELGSNSEEHFDTLVKRSFNKIPERKLLAITSQGITEYNTVKQKRMKLYPDAKKVLRILIKRGFSLGILTKGRKKKQWDKINRLSLYEFFGNNVWIVTDDQSKEQAIKDIINEFNLSQQEIMLVGDRPDSDIKAAKKAGIKSVQLMKGPYKNMKGSKPDYKINNLKELITLI